MTRIERARAVRDQLIARETGWSLTPVAGGEVASIEFAGGEAVLWSPVAADPEAPRPFGFTPKKPKGESTHYLLEVWVDGSKVLAASWNWRDELTILRMVRGEWEWECFGLPLPSGRSRPTIH